MTEQQNLPAPHAKPEATHPKSKCSLLRRAYSIDRMAEPANSARGAGNRPARKQMLA